MFITLMLSPIMNQKCLLIVLFSGIFASCLIKFVHDSTDSTPIAVSWRLFTGVRDSHIHIGLDATGLKQTGSAAAVGAQPMTAESCLLPETSDSLCGRFHKSAILWSDKCIISLPSISPFVGSIDDSCLSRIDQKKSLLHAMPATYPAVLRARQAAFLDHIYHSNAMEGNTLTLWQTKAIIDTRRAVGGKSLAEHNEVLGLDAALGFVNSTLVDRVGSLSLQDILELHHHVLGHVDPTRAGQLRSTQVMVGEFRPAPALEVPALMNGLLTWINSQEALSMHPVQFAAIAHYELVCIHPFYDGNGRTSRLLMNVILMRAGYPPVSVLVKDRMRYYKTLSMANSGDARPFIRLMAESTERTLDEFMAAMMDSQIYSLQHTSDQHRTAGQQAVLF